MEKVLGIIGAGEAALPIINKAKEMGIVSVAFGENNSLAKDSADVFICRSIFDIDGIVDDCRNNNVNGIIASSEITTESAALVAERMGLPGNECKDGFFARNKYLMRERIKNAKYVKQPDYHLYSNNEIPTFPIMVKAVDSCGKRGIHLVNNYVEYETALKNAKEVSSDDSVLIESYLQGGLEYSVECLAYGKETSVIQITKKETSGP